jgi:hypothetical protein
MGSRRTHRCEITPRGDLATRTGRPPRGTDPNQRNRTSGIMRGLQGARPHVARALSVALLTAVLASVVNPFATPASA